MATIESIRETLVPPLVATLIAIYLVTDRGPSTVVNTAAAQDDLPATVFRDRQADSHLKKMCLPDKESPESALALLVYRIPVFRERIGHYARAVLQWSGMTERLALLSTQCSQAMTLASASKSWWM